MGSVIFNWIFKIDEESQNNNDESYAHMIKEKK